MKWVIRVIMVMVLLTGVSMLSAARSAENMHPKSVSDLSPFKVTIQSITLPPPGVPGPQVLTPKGYYTKFIVMHAPALATAVDAKALAGQSATVYLRSKDAEMLNEGGLNLTVATWAYGIQLANGKVLSDPAAVVANSKSKPVLYTPIIMIAISVLYFLFVFFYKGKEDVGDAMSRRAQRMGRQPQHRSTRAERLGIEQPPSRNENP